MTEKPLLERARACAEEKHRGQFRKGAAREPYVVHVEHVALIVEKLVGSADQNLIAAAYLHDVIEDSEETRETLALTFGEDVADLVAQLSDPPGLSEQDRRQAQIDHAPQLSDRAKLIKIADKVSNLDEMFRDPPPGWSVEKRLAYLKWGEDVFAGLRGLSKALDTLFLETAMRLRTSLESFLETAMRLRTSLESSKD